MRAGVVALVNPRALIASADDDVVCAPSAALTLTIAVLVTAVGSGASINDSPHTDKLDWYVREASPLGNRCGWDCRRGGGLGQRVGDGRRGKDDGSLPLVVNRLNHSECSDSLRLA
jgi:hypothetical protein